MIRTIAVLIGAAATLAAQPAPTSLTLTWIGQSAFAASTNTGFKALLDPVGANMGYKTDAVTGVDVVTVSHEHGDHNNVQMAAGSPTILRGLANGEVAKIDQTVKGVRIRTVASFHDSEQGAQRGKNAIFIYEFPGLKLAHLGDLGHKLTPEEVAAIGPVDVLLIPVGGGPTIDPQTAAAVTAQLNPKVIVPMHCANSANSAGGRMRFASPDDFIKAAGAAVASKPAGHTLTLTATQLPAKPTVMTMTVE